MRRWVDSPEGPRDIETDRLVLRHLDPAFLRATLDGETALRLGDRLGLRVPEDWLAEVEIAAIRLEDQRLDPAYAEWSLRAVGLRTTGEMVGHAGFHTRPGAAYLAEVAADGVELGYTIFAAHRRRGYAREAAAGLIAWAHRERGVSRFVATVNDGNTASRALLESMGFARVGRQMDERDGPEDVLRLDLGPSAG